MQFDEQILQEKVLNELERLLNKYVKDFTFSSNYKTQVMNLAIKKLHNQNKVTSMTITETLKAIIGKSFLDTMRAKPNSSLYKYFFEPYKHIYEKSNALFGITSAPDNLLLFVNITINIVFKDSFGVEQDILVMYQNYLREYKKRRKNDSQNTSVASEMKILKEKQKEEQKVEKKEEFLLEKKFAKDKSILYTVLPTLSQRENQVIRNIIQREARKDYLEYPYAVDKLMKGIRLYFLLKALNYNYSEINEKITLAHQNHNYPEVLMQLQNKFLENTIYKSDSIENEIEILKRKSPSLAKTIAIFLGLEEYDYSMTTDEIINAANHWKDTLLAKSTSFFEQFSDVPKEKIKLIVYCFKNEYSTYYEVLTKYHGPYLHQISLVEKEDQDIYYQAIQKILEVLQLEKKGQIIIDSHDKLFFDTKILEENFKVSIEENNALSKILPEIPLDDLESIINSFQVNKKIYLRVLLQKHGLTFQENNSLSQEEQRFYEYAIKKIKKDYQKIISLNEKNLFEKLDITTEKEKKKVLEVISNYRVLYPRHYQILIKKHGEKFQEVYPLTEEEKDQYLYIFKILKSDLTRPIDLFHEFPNVSKQKIKDIVEVLKEKNPDHYQALITIHGESLLENHLITPLNRTAYQKALNCLRNILNNDRKSLYQILDPIPKKQVDHLLDILKRNYPNYYAIIIERFGNSLLEWNKILPTKNNTYAQAIGKMKKINDQLEEVSKKLAGITPQELQICLKEYQYHSPKSYQVLIKRHGIDFTEFNRLNADESNLYHMALERFTNFAHNYQKNARSIFERLPLIPEEFIRKNIEEWKTTYPNYYHAATLKHGENLLEEHRIPTHIGTTYDYVLKKLRNDYRNYILADYKKTTPKRVLVKTLRENKEFLHIVKAMRKIQNFDEIKETYQLSNDELAQILANYLLLFSNPKDIISEIVRHSDNGLACLLNSSNFLVIYDAIPQVFWNHHLSIFVKEHPELQPYKFIFTK